MAITEWQYSNDELLNKPAQGVQDHCRTIRSSYHTIVRHLVKDTSILQGSQFDEGLCELSSALRAWEVLEFSTRAKHDRVSLHTAPEEVAAVARAWSSDSGQQKFNMTMKQLGLTMYNLAVRTEILFSMMDSPGSFCWSLFLLSFFFGS